MAKKNLTKEEKITVCCFILACIITAYGWNVDLHWLVNILVGLFWFFVISAIVYKVFGIKTNIANKKTDLKNPKRSPKYDVAKDEFMKTIWKSDDGIVITIEYEDFNDNKTRRSVLLKEIIKDCPEVRESIRYDEEMISSYQEDLHNLDKNDEHYRLEKEEIMERIRELKQGIKESKKEVTNKNSENYDCPIYLRGFCLLRNKDRNFKLDRISAFYDNEGIEISKGDLFGPLGITGKVKQELQKYNKDSYPILLWSDDNGLQYTVKYLDEYNESGDSDFVENGIITKENSYNLNILEVRAATEKSYKSVCVVGKSKNKEKVMDIRNIVNFTDASGNVKTVYDFLMSVGLNKLAERNMNTDKK